jgi:MFS family permease
MFLVLFVVFVLRRLAGGAGEVGLLRGMQAVGGIAGGLVLGALASRLSHRALVGGGCFGFAAVCLAIWNLPALTTALPAYVLLFVLVGLPVAAGTAGLTAVLLAAAPEEFRGRVVSTALVAGAAAQAVGTLAAGVLVDPVGLLPLLQVHAALGAVAGLVALRTLRTPAGRPVAAEHAGEDDARAVRAAVVEHQRVVPLQPPAALHRPDGPLDHQQVGAGREAADHHVPGPDPRPRPDQQRVAVPQGGHHRGTDDEDAPDRPPE